MSETLLWWLLLELIGIAVLPIAFRFFRNLPDRGYAFIKPLGLLLMAYPYWLLTSFGFTANTRGAVLGIAIVVAGLSWYFGNRRRTEDEGRKQENSHLSSVVGLPSLADWLRDNRKYILTVELVFTVAFFAWAIYRAYVSDISATEKPMEFAFLNGILQSEHFPPRDPWLAGYAISYYYFGYVVVAMLTLLSGVLPSIAFNLALAMLFALSATGAYGLVYNLIQYYKLQITNDKSLISHSPNLFFPIFAPIFLVLIGNLEGLFESLHSAGLGDADFWKWLDIKQLADAPVTGSYIPTDNWWWWRASRVVHDVVRGQTNEVIDEFPQFSFLLGDLHPHVLALPFALLALAVALNLINSKFKIQNLGDAPRNFNFEFPISNFEFSLLPLILGGLFFLNTWDILPYGFILVAAFAVARYRAENAWNRRATSDLTLFVVALGALSLFLYFPFYLSFQSQAGGILPTLFVKTRLHQYLIMFGLFVFILGAYLWRVAAERGEPVRGRFMKIVTSAMPFLGFPLLIIYIATFVVAVIPPVRDSVAAFLPGATGEPLKDILNALTVPLVESPWLYFMLTLILTVLVYLFRTRLAALDTTTLFVLLIVFTGFLLTYGVEFVYLRDQFGSRMNTVFKFYFQTWTLFSVAGGYAVWYLSRKLGRVAHPLWFVGFTVLLAASFIYPAFAIPNRADGFKGEANLDGLHWIQNLNRGDYDAIQWLRANAPRGSVIVEAVGDDYGYGNRISMATGLATPMGWVGHESQWHGGSKLFQDDAAGVDRPKDVRAIYQSLDTLETLTLLAKYDIKFVIVGGEEKTKYNLTSAHLNKFNRIMTLVSESSGTQIYQRGK